MRMVGLRRGKQYCIHVQKKRHANPPHVFNKLYSIHINSKYHSDLPCAKWVRAISKSNCSLHVQNPQRRTTIQFGQPLSQGHSYGAADTGNDLFFFFFYDGRPGSGHPTCTKHQDILGQCADEPNEPLYNIILIICYSN